MSLKSAAGMAVDMAAGVMVAMVAGMVAFTVAASMARRRFMVAELTSARRFTVAASASHTGSTSTAGSFMAQAFTPPITTRTAIAGSSGPISAPAEYAVIARGGGTAIIGAITGIIAGTGSFWARLSPAGT